MYEDQFSKPRPVMVERLSWLLGAGVDVKTVVDVGVQHGTDFLIKCCPDVPHILIEAVDEYIPNFCNRYGSEGIVFEVICAALADEDGVAWQLGFSRDGSGAITHSRISNKPADSDTADLISCKEVRKLSLDTVTSNRHDSLPYLLKIDVDGHEMPILRGAASTLASCSIVIVEATIDTIGVKIELLSKFGFVLFDISDLCYYYHCLSQVDLIFVHADWISRCDDLRPWHAKQFSWEKWQPLHSDW